MAINHTEQRQQLLEHYIQLAQTEGWGSYTRERLQQLAMEPMYADFPQLVAQAMKTSQTPESPLC